MAAANPLVNAFAGLVYYKHMAMERVPAHLQIAVSAEVATYGEDPYFDDHRHLIDHIEGLQDALDGKVSAEEGKALFSGSYTDLTDTPAAPTAEDIPTTEGSTVEAELTSLKQSGSDAKTSIATAITAKGVEASSSDTFVVLANKIEAISEGAQIANGVLAVGAFDIIAPFNIDFLVLLAEGDEVATFAPATYRGFGTGNGYEYTQGRMTCSFNGNTVTVSGAALDASVTWVAIGE